MNGIEATMKFPPPVSVIIANWNGLHYLDDCLASLKRQSFRNFEVILVDNGSQDGSIDFVRQHYAEFVHTVMLLDNRGFAGGNNAGIAVSRGEYVALLNNDAVADPEWLAQLVLCMRSDERIGMVGSKILNYFRPDEIDNTGHLIYPDGLNRGRGRLEVDKGQYDQQHDILFPSGCASLYKKKMLDEMGGFDETFFAYGDDADIGLHGRCLGYRAVYCPQAIAYHKYSGTTGQYSPMKAFYVERNRVWILIKYFPVGWIIFSPYFTLKRMILHGYGVLTHQGAAARLMERTSVMLVLKTILKAYSSASKRMPMMLKRRKLIWSNKKMSTSEWKTLLKTHSISGKEIALKD
jgi:GT2 family glycosyltransferase